MKRSETQVVAEIEEITLRRLRLWVRNGWILPDQGPEEPVYDELDVARVRLVCELKDKMNLNDDALPVALSLLDQLYGMRRDFKALASAVEEQPPEVREEVLAAWRRLLEG